jgi:hypothetical protein
MSRCVFQVETGDPCSNSINSQKVHSNCIKFHWISIPRTPLNSKSNSILNFEKIQWGKLFLISFPTISYFISKILSLEKSYLDRIKFEQVWFRFEIIWNIFWISLTNRQAHRSAPSSLPCSRTHAAGWVMSPTRSRCLKPDHKLCTHATLTPTYHALLT